MSIDYEKEYNARLCVPEHPEIFARWAREAEAFRNEMAAAGRSELGLRYGTSPRQIVDLFFPAARTSAPLAVFIHGGYWRAGDPSMYSHMARGLCGRGVTVALIGYDLCPQVTVAQIVDEVRAGCLFLWKRFGRRLLVSGHSAGGHLTAAMLATDWRARDASAPADLVPAGYAISGIFELAPLIHTSMNAEIRLDDASARAASPLFWPVRAGLVLDTIVGGAEPSEFHRQSKTLVDDWATKGVATRYEAAPGKNHFSAIEPLTDPDSAMVARIADLAAG